MNNSPDAKSSEQHAPLSREDMMSALFAHMVTQQANLAMMLMGKVAHPESGKAIRDLEAAQLFIDQLEMLQQKTKGNLTIEEQRALDNSITELRFRFVQAIDESKTG